MVYANIMQTKQLFCYQASFLVWGSVQATTCELWPQNCLQRHLVLSFVDFWVCCSIVLGVAHIVRSYPDYWNLCICELAEVRLCCFLVTWPCRPIQCNRGRRCASKYLLYLLNMIAPIFGLSSCDYSNHLNINSQFCVCLCVWLKLERVFTAFVSSTKVFISSANTFISNTKSVHPQSRTHSSLVINMSVYSVIRIWK